MMPTETELRERYGSYSNQRLLSIVHRKEQYTPEAVEIARAELAERNISTQDLDIFYDEQEACEAAARALAAVPLNKYEKALFFFLWFMPWFLGRALRLNYEEDGLMLKERQSRIYALAGFVSLLVDGIVSVYFKLGNLFSIVCLLIFYVAFQWIEKRKATNT
ncbi:MAG TPA: hypothetical protein VFT90_15945 [Chryseosolibacter sp.]|nr:hypothetical protein [Chryseosolibacter sp.]